MRLLNRLKTEEFSISRVFSGVSVVLAICFCTWPYLEFPAVYATEALQFQGALLLTSYIIFFGLLGVVLSYRGYPLWFLSTSLLLAPLYFLMFYGANELGLKVLTHFGFILAVLVSSNQIFRQLR